MAKAAGPKTTAKEFEARIQRTRDWRSVTLARLRTLIRKADPEIVEELKWKKPSNPEGDPVWSHDGIVCVGNTLKSSVRLTFPSGAEIRDPKKLFNSRLDSKSVRAIDVHEGEELDPKALIAIVAEAVRRNRS
jgi:hypothetical protein